MAGYKRQIGLAALIFMGVNSMIGSGWLFGSFFSAQLAGPSAIITWLLAGIISLLIAMPFASLGSMLPINGSFAQATYLTYGRLSGFLISCISWLSMASIAPIEIQAILLYAANYFPQLVVKQNTAYVLSHLGLIISILLMGFFTFLNYFSLRWVSKFNSSITIWKLAIPSLLIIVFFSVSFHPSNFTSHGFWMNGSHGTLSALINGGAIYSFFGFLQIIAMAGEVKDPGKTIPRALLLSIFIVGVVYVALQVAYIGALSPKDIANGWSHLNYANDKGPMAGLAENLGLLWLAVLLYIDAFISPMGTGLVYTTSTARVLEGIAENGDLPKFLTSRNRYEVPFKALFCNFIYGVIFLIYFSGWQSMASFIVLAMAIGYAMIPLCLTALTKRLPDCPQPFRLYGEVIFAFISFAACNFLIYLSGWEIYRKFLHMSLLILVIFFAKRIYKKALTQMDVRNGLWVIVYLVGLGFISYLGMFGHGKNILMHYWDIFIVFLWSLVIFLFAKSSALPADVVRQNLKNML